MHRVFRRLGYYLLAVVLFIPMLFARRITLVPEAIDFSENDAEFLALHEGEFERTEITEPRFGHKLQVTFFPAETGKDGMCVLIAHGLGGKIEQMYPQAIALHDDGCDVCLFDFRGHGDSGGAFSSLGYLEMFDIAAIADWLRCEKKSRRIVLYGFSMGAVAAVLAAAYGGSVDGVIAESPFDSMENIVMHNARKMFRVPRFLVKLLLWGTDVHRNIEYKIVDLLRALPRLEGVPMLLVGTSSDATVPVAQTRRVADHLGEGHVYWEIEGPAHGAILQSEHGAELRRRIRELLDRC